MTDDLLDEKDERVRAATIIQNGVRRYLTRKRRRGPARGRPLQSQNVGLTKEKLRTYQDEIDLYQQKHKSLNLTPTEFQEQHRKAQFLYAKFAQTLGRKRVQEHRFQATLVQAQNIVGILESAPKLKDYTSDQLSFFALAHC